jgi:branched-chain amino acid aminotransferase
LAGEFVGTGRKMSDARQVYMNGNFVDEVDAKVSIYDSSLMFGDMVFEMTRSFNGVQFKLKEHIERLYAGTSILQIPMPITPDEMQEICIQTIKRNQEFFRKDDEHRLLIDVSRGLLGIYQDIPGAHIGTNIIVADFPLRRTVSTMGKLFDCGVNLVIPSQRAIPSRYLDPKIKNRSRIFYLMANIEVSRVKGENNWALLLDDDGFLTEGTGDNFFLVRNNVIYTPEGRNILRGISRQYVIDELGPQLGYQVIEKNLEPYDLYTADEAFITGTPFCMLPVSSLNGSRIGKGNFPGKVFEELICTWGANVGIDLISQIKGWSSDSLGSGPTPYQFKPK